MNKKVLKITLIFSMFFTMTLGLIFGKNVTFADVAQTPIYINLKVLMENKLDMQ